MPSIRLHWVAERLAACVVPISRSPATLWPEEEALLVGATLRRRAEFSAGRDAARRGMLALGAAAVGVGQGTEGEPLFPAQLRGSISHIHQFAVAVVGLAADFDSVGVDLDDARALGDAAASGVTWEAEVLRIQRAVGCDRAAAQNFAFSAKEAVFKCQYPLTGDAGIRAHQARLLDRGPQSSGEMAVVGWRVASATAGVLKRVLIQRVLMENTVLAVATIAATLADERSS